MRAVLFDLDGTLWDPEPHIFKAYAEVYREHGHVLSRSRWSSVLGTIGFNLWTDLERLTGRPVDRTEVEARVARRTKEELSGLTARPGVAGFLRQADNAGFDRALVSNSPTAWITRYARQCGLGAGWRGIHSAEGDALRAKPKPDLYEEALACLGVRPEEALAFEDSPSGVRAARAAGVRCVAVPNAMTAVLDLSQANVRLDSFLDADLLDLIGLFEDTTL